MREQWVHVGRGAAALAPLLRYRFQYALMAAALVVVAAAVVAALLRIPQSATAER